mgnify:CR=1 FL=1
MEVEYNGIIYTKGCRIELDPLKSTIKSDYHFVILVGSGVPQTDDITNIEEVVIKKRSHPSKLSCDILVPYILRNSKKLVPSGFWGYKGESDVLKGLAVPVYEQDCRGYKKNVWHWTFDRKGVLQKIRVKDVDPNTGSKKNWRKWWAFY